MTTVISVAAGVIFLRDTFNLWELCGGVPILLGVWGTNRYTMDRNVVPTRE